MDTFKITIYTRKQCPLCDEAMDILSELKSEFPIEIEEIDIYKNDELLEKYQLMIPVIEINEEQVDYGMISKEIVRNYIFSKIV